jgi:ribosomal protein L14
MSCDRSDPPKLVCGMCQERSRRGTVVDEKTGDRIVVVVKKQRNFGPETGNSVSISAANKVRRGDVRHAVVVRTAKKWQRPDGSVVKFDDNACVLINKAGEPIGSRVSGVVAAELKQMQWSKILSLAPMHV